MKMERTHADFLRSNGYNVKYSFPVTAKRQIAQKNADK